MRNRTFAILVFLLAAPAAAEETANFLKIGIGARAIGMGGAYTAVADDVTAMGWNPAGLSLLRKREAAFMHAELAGGARFDYAGYAQPTRYGAFGAGLTFLSQGSLQGRDVNGRVTGDFSASDSALSLAYARAASKRLALGGVVKIIRSRIADESAAGAAFDLGSRYALGAMGPGKASLGLALQNMGPEMKLLDQSNPLPMTLAAGLGYALPVGLTMAVDYKYRPYAGSNSVGIGTEYSVMPSLDLRIGYAASHAAASGSTRADDLTGFSTGFGVRALGMGLDYSATPFGALGNAHRVSLGVKF